MTLSLEQATDLLERRNRAFEAADPEAFLALWSEDCVVEGPAHLLRGKQELGASLTRAWGVFEPLHMTVHSLAVQGDALFYEWVFVAKLRHDGSPLVASGMTFHQVDDQGRFTTCREYFDPPDTRRASVLAISSVGGGANGLG